MKKLKSLLAILLVVVTMLPFTANAEVEVEKPETDKEPVKVYVFRGETCSYCKAALEWFDSIKEEYGDYFELVTYEVWNNSENAELMQKVASHMGDTANGVPYIIVGKYTYPNGFGADTKLSDNSDKTMGDQLIERILEIYQSDNRYDVMEDLNNKKDYSAVVATGAIIIIAGLAVVAIVSRKQNQ